ncbi:MAG: InlB B-repeat-containing protein, partial [Spirochaetales bacterium]|nr:InlB B-repeat-containing protein [Spirochaetales bacterium]
MLLIIICVIFGMVSCRTETESSPVTSASDGKISSLQIAVDKAAVGDVIDLSDSKYNEIKDYKADINKALTIKGSAGKTDFDNAKLIVTADGVELSSVSNVSIQTQSYLKIQSSSLNNLTIMTDGGRSGASAADTKPNVELSSTTVAGALNIMIDSSVVVFSGSANKVAQISSDVSAVVYLEDGTSDNKIPAPTVTGDGEVIYIDKTAESEIRLIALTPYSGLKTVFRVGETFDLSELVMMGTYEADDDGTTVYRAGELSYRMKSTFTRLERITPEWEASAGGDDIISGDGICQKSGTVAVIVEKDSCRFEYDISIIDDSPSDTPPILNDLSVKAQPRKKNYLAGEKLDLSGLVVLAEYHIGNAVYQTVVTDYTTSPAVGSSLTVDIQSLIISFGGKSVNVDIEVKAAWTVRYIVDMTDDAKNFTKQVADSGLAVELTDVMKSGYSYLGWCTDRECYNNYDFGTPVTSDLTLYAKWLENANNFNITYRDAGDTKFSGQFAGTPGTDYPVTHHYGDETVLVSPSRFGYLFDGWFKSAECAGEAVTKIGAQEYTSSFTLYAKWKPNEYNITYCDAGGLDLSGDFSGDYPQKHLYGSETVLPVPSGIHGEFKGWHRTADCSDTAMTSIGGEDVSSDITLYAKW